jgi:arylsulfatase A-like enzyme
MVKHPNLLFVFGDQWRRSALGCTGDPNVRTPNIDRFAAQSVDCRHATAGWPVCCPWRASLLTGQYPLTHGIVVNDQSLRSEHVSFAQALDASGYHTAWVGKWHIDGRGRHQCVPPERREGFQLWRGYECSHNYHESDYWDDRCERHRWQGYDAVAQTDFVIDHLREQPGRDRPFAMFLSWGPPHTPYDAAPERYRAMYDAAALRLPENVPPELHDEARRDLAGYYAHCTALDVCFGRLLDTLRATGLERDTIVVFASDHGDMLGSHGLRRKQQPYAESIDVPLFVRWPGRWGLAGRVVQTPVNVVDYMPTLLGLCGVPIPATVQGDNLAAILEGQAPDAPDRGVLLACYRPFHEWHYRSGGREYRGWRTARHTYVRDRNGPWLLFDNATDPGQRHNLVADARHAALMQRMDEVMHARLRALGDGFESGDELARRLGIALNERDDVAYE